MSPKFENNVSTLFTVSWFVFCYQAHTRYQVPAFKLKALFFFTHPKSTSLIVFFNSDPEFSHVCSWSLCRTFDCTRCTILFFYCVFVQAASYYTRDEFLELEPVIVTSLDKLLRTFLKVVLLVLLVLLGLIVLYYL